MHALIPACCGSFLQPSASAHLRAQVKNGPRHACTYTCVLLLVFAAFCKCTPPGTGDERTPRCTHFCLRAAVRFLQPSASAHLRGQVKNGPRDACTYACVLRFVFAAFCKCTPAGTGEEQTSGCMHLYLPAAVRFCSLPQVHTSGDR